jgi:hypothetical protein
VLLISIHILIDNLRGQPATASGKQWGREDD